MNTSRSSTSNSPTIRGYEIREKIGEGSYGAVYRAIHQAVNREVAVKVILPQHANQPEFIRRFEVEAQIAARLEHPHIVPLYDYWREPDGAYLVMRFIKGGNLASTLESGPLDTMRVATLLNQIAAGLDAAHRQGVIHRDLKPANILLDESGNAYLSDFGIAKVLGSFAEQTQSGKIFGTPAYISPEQLKSEPVIPQSDIYSLGIMLYHMLTGVKPFPDESLASLVQKHLFQSLPSVQQEVSDLPEQVDRVIQRATFKDPADRYADALSLAQAFRQAVNAPSDPVVAAIPFTTALNPYKGLRAFQEADAKDFFGREALTGRLINRLAETGEGARFLAVVGPSGSGKSSVVKAGLIPAIRAGKLPGSESWYIVEMLPGAHPYEELEISLLRIATNPSLSLMEQTRRDQRGLLRAARLALPSDDSQLLLVIDQFEEIFTLVEDENEAREFLASLYTAVTDARSPLRVVITLRADFYDRPLMIPDFSTLVQNRTEVVIPLTLEELERAIISPSRRAGVSIDSGMVTAIVADVVEQPGILPLLQYALTELFEKRRDHRLSLEDYQQLGGVKGVLEGRAEETYTGLSETGKSAARQVFLRLVTLGEGIEDTRRRVLLSELEAVTLPSIGEESTTEEKGSAIAITEAIDAYGGDRLLSFDRDPLLRSPTVEITHEALLKGWPRLRQWLDESRADVRLQRALASYSAEWIKAGRESSFLLHGARLDQFSNWAEETSLALTGGERLFLAASLADRQKRREAETARQEREAALERRSRNFLRGLVALFAVAALVAGLLSLFAFDQQRIARENEQLARNEAEGRATQQMLAESEALARATQQALAESEADARATAESAALLEKEAAEEQARLSASRELAVMAINKLEADPEFSILLSLHALENAHTREAEESLHSAIQASRVRMALTGHAGGANSVAFSPDGSTIATSGYTEGVTLWEASSGQKLYDLPEGTARVARYSLDGRYLAAGSNDGTVIIWDLPSRQVHLSLTGHGKGIQEVRFSPNGRLLVSSSLDDTFKVWETETGQDLFSSSAATGGFDTFSNVAFNPGGSLLISTDFLSSEETEMKVWGVDRDWALLNQFQGFAILVLSPDGRWLAAAKGAQLNDIQLWDLAKLSTAELSTLNLSTVEPLVIPETHKAVILNFAFSPDGMRMATASLDGTAKVWSLSPDGVELLMTLSGHDTSVLDVAFSPDGARLATASGDGTVKVWDITPAGTSELFAIAAHSRNILRFGLNADGKYLATASPDGNARVWDLVSGEKLIEISGDGTPLFGADISQDGKFLATAGFDNLAKIWKLDLSPEAASAELLHTLTGHAEGPPVGGVFPGLTSVVFSPDGSKLATGGVDPMAKVWDVKTGEELLSVQAEPDGSGVTNLAFSPDGLLLATASDDVPSGTTLAKIWEIASGKEIATFTGLSDSGRIAGMAFSPDGTRVATGAWNGESKVWDTYIGKELLNLLGHTSGVFGMAFSSDGKYLASTSIDGTARVWDASSGEELLVYASPSGPFFDVAISPDDKYIYASGQGLVYGYVLDLDELIRLAYSRLTRWFTPEECRQFLHLETCPAEPGEP